MSANRLRGGVVSVGLVMLLCSATAQADEPRASVVVVVGAEGTPEFGTQFKTWAERWNVAAKRGQAESVVLGLEPEGEKSDRDLLHEHLNRLAPTSTEPLWLILIGHGTYDGKTARFNLRGEDITPIELGTWLTAVQRPLAVVNCSSCSAPFLTALSGPDRVTITATKAGQEYNFSRFGDYLSAAIGDPAGDLDKDEQTSLLEAFVVASARLREFYKRESRLATEHPLIDDNADHLGTPADWFEGLKPVKAAKAGATLDGGLARQFVLVRNVRDELLSAEVRARRDALERDLAVLRNKKAAMAEAEYFEQLEVILVELARLSP